MIPILYSSTETAFTSNGIARLRDCISCTVTEERNGIYECDFEYPIDGAHFELISIGKIIGVTHDEFGDVQPFDIVSYTRPINGVVTFHAVHISYRLCYITAVGQNINSLSAAFAMFRTGLPSCPFTFTNAGTSTTGYMGCADGTPRSVRQMLGGIEGSVLDTYGGEYEWDKFNVILHQNRGSERGFAIRYGVNMLGYNEEYDASGTYAQCVPYWTNGSGETVVGDLQDTGAFPPSGRKGCVPLDVSDKFQDKPTKAQVNAAGLKALKSKRPTIPAQSINVEFINNNDLQDSTGYNVLARCRLCDVVKVYFPDLNSTGNFKIVKTVWNVLTERYDSMELGVLSVSLAEALGISDNLDKKLEIPTKTSDLTNDSGYVDASDFIFEDVLFADDVTVSGQTYANGNQSVTKAGYKTIGIVGMHIQNATNGGQNNTTCAVHSFYMVGDTAYWIVRGTTTATAKIKVTGSILYVKN